MWNLFFFQAGFRLWFAASQAIHRFYPICQPAIRQYGNIAILLPLSLPIHGGALVTDESRNSLNMDERTTRWAQFWTHTQLALLSYWGPVWVVAPRSTDCMSEAWITCFVVKGHCMLTTTKPMYSSRSTRTLFLSKFRSFRCFQR